MTNEHYLDSIGVTGEARKRCLEAMAKYQENHWWEPDVDPRKYAYFQLHEPIWLTNGGSHDLHGAVEVLLGRPVYTHELFVSYEDLKQEAERAWKYQVGCTSDRERAERVVESNKKLQDWGEANGKPVSIVVEQ